MTEASQATEQPQQTQSQQSGEQDGSQQQDKGADAIALGGVADKGAGAGQGGDMSAAAADTEAWRVLIAGEDQSILKELQRVKAPTDLGKLLVQQKQALSKRSEAPKLTNDATPQQIAEYRRFMGAPEIAADAKVEDIAKAYGVAVPEGYEATEVEKAMLADFAKTMNGKHAPAGVVKEASDFFFKAQTANKQAMNQLDATKQREWQGELRTKLGKEYEPMVAAGEAFLNQKFAENLEAKNVLLNARLPGGGRLGDHPAFVEMMVDLALNNGFTDRIEANDMESNGKSLAEQQRELEQLQFKDRNRYNDPGVQAKLNKIIELRLSRGEIDDQGNEVKARRRAS